MLRPRPGGRVVGWSEGGRARGSREGRTEGVGNHLGGPLDRSPT